MTRCSSIATSADGPRRSGTFNLLQQVLLNAFLAPRIAFSWKQRLSRRRGNRRVFAALHLPNPGLTFCRSSRAVGWREWFRRHPNLPAVWASHFLLSLAVMATQDPESFRRMRVGAAYLTSAGESTVSDSTDFREFFDAAFTLTDALRRQEAAVFQPMRFAESRAKSSTIASSKTRSAHWGGEASKPMSRMRRGACGSPRG